MGQFLTQEGGHRLARVLFYYRLPGGAAPLASVPGMIDDAAQEAAEVVDVGLGPTMAGVDRDLARAGFADGRERVPQRVADTRVVEGGQPAPGGSDGGQASRHRLHQRAAPALTAGGREIAIPSEVSPELP